MSAAGVALSEAMSVLAFIAAMAQALAWPVVAAAVVVVFRHEVSALLNSRLKRLKAGPFEGEWEVALAHAEADAEVAAVPAALEPPPEAIEGEASRHGRNAPPAPLLTTELADLARVKPAGAVMEAYKRVEVQLKTLVARRTTYRGDVAKSAAALAVVAAQAGVITHEAANAVKGLSVLRNLVVHGDAERVTAERAMEYLSLADAVLLTLPEG